MAATEILILIVTVILILYGYFKYTLNYWKRRQIPNVPTSIPFGNLGNPKYRKNPVYEYLREAYVHCKKINKNHGGFFIMNKPFYVPINPEIIKNILVKDFNYFSNKGFYYNKKSDPLTANLFSIDHNDWRNMRVKVTPTFTAAKMKMMFYTLLACAEAMVEKIGSDPPVMDVKEILSCYTTDVIGSCAFGFDCNSFKDPNSEFRFYGRKLFEYSAIKSLIRMITIIFPSFSKSIGILFIPKDISNFFLNIVENMVNHRENNNVQRKDFMQLLIELKQNDELDIKELAAQCFAFFVAGYETSSTTVTYCLYELSKHPEMQDKIRSEIKQCRDKYGEITYEGIIEMTFLNQVVEETLRLYPTLPYLNRKCIKDYKIDEDLTIDKGTGIFISTYGLHTDPEYFPNPETFDPERFSNENRKDITPYTYLPFGEGPRNCIGMRFGLMQTKVGLIRILENFKLKLNKATPMKLSLDPNSFFLQSKENILLDVEKIFK